AREREQEIERPFEALDVNDERALVRGELGREIGSGKLHDIRRHQTFTSVSAAPAMRCAKSARARSKSIRVAGLRAANAASPRRQTRLRAAAPPLPPRAEPPPRPVPFPPADRCSAKRGRNRPPAPRGSVRRSNRTGHPSRRRRSSAALRIR